MQATVYEPTDAARLASLIPNERAELFRQFGHFLRTYEYANGHTYSWLLITNYSQGVYALPIVLEHIRASIDRDVDAASSVYYKLIRAPELVIPALEEAVQEVLSEYVPTAHSEGVIIPPIQLLLNSEDQTTVQTLRDLTSGHVGSIAHVRAIVISAGKVTQRARSLHVRCRGCSHSLDLNVPYGLTSVRLPVKCQNPDAGTDCGDNSYRAVPELSTFTDFQRLKLQELPELCPSGEMPRTITAIVDGFLADRVAPGTRVEIVGLHSVFRGAHKGAGVGGGLTQTSTPYIRVNGLAVDLAAGPQRAATGRYVPVQPFRNDVPMSLGGYVPTSPAEAARFQALARQPGFIDRLIRSVAPGIFGSTSLKAAVACSLFGGTTKIMGDGMRLRGECNALFLGDPGTGKSQLLRWASQAAPIAVLTSGKGSSAAGLTAAVNKDVVSGEFYLEGGAMVLADGGLVCCDEFDKMREQDRVAIHEAMEQGTVSVAKAGITTILNARATILAAANPVYGRYDELRAPGEQIELQSTILSRFDLIFIVTDSPDSQRDQQISRHVIGLHARSHIGFASATSPDEELLDIPDFRRFCAFARTHCEPRLSPAAATAIENAYVTMRSEVHNLRAARDQGRAAARDQSFRSAETAEAAHGIPLTVRQLEAIVRLSEAFARMELSETVTPEHVARAEALFKESTLQAAKSGLVEIEGMQSAGLEGDIEAAQRQILQSTRVGLRVEIGQLVAQLEGQGISHGAARKALDKLESDGVISRVQRGRHVLRRR
jgi:DNA replication licensing factor MCM5